MNVKSFFGLRPVGGREHSGYEGVKAYFLPASAPTVAAGDLVTKVAGLNPNPVYGYKPNTLPQASVLTAAAAGAITGVIVGVGPDKEFAIQTGQSGATGSDRLIWVQDSIETHFEVCAADGATVSVGGNANIVYAAPSMQFGISQVALASSANTATLPLKVVDVRTAPDNDPTQPNAIYVVRINNSTEAPGTAGV